MSPANNILVKAKHIFSFILLSLFASLSHASPTVTVWSYYEAPPFKTNENNAGLAQDFVDLLNQMAQQTFLFQLHTIPRSRLNHYLDNGKNGVVLFVNWAWMGKTSKQDYFWSEALMQDRNEIISSVHKPVNYDGPDSLANLNFVGVRGRRYSKFEALITSGETTRTDVNNEEIALTMIVAGRVDFTSQPKSLALALKKKLKLGGKLYFSPKPLFSFKRYIMTSKNLPQVHAFLLALSKDIQNLPQWQALLKKYDM